MTVGKSLWTMALALASADPYWLARCEGWHVETPSGRLGTVCRLLYGSDVDTPDALLIQTGILRRRQILIDTQTVSGIVPSEGKLLLDATPDVVDLPTVLRDRVASGRDRRSKPAA